MNVFVVLLNFKFFLVFSCLIQAYNLQNFNFDGENSGKIIKINAPFQKINDNSTIEAAILENFCVGTEANCFSVILNLHEQNTFIIDKPATNCGITPTYDSKSSTTYRKENIVFTYVDTVFGNVNYLKSFDKMQLNVQSDPTNFDNQSFIYEQFPFRNINKINRCSQVISNGLLGLGPNNELLKRLKENSTIDQMNYSVELADNKKSLQITIGDYSQSIKSAISYDKITYCNIVASTFVNEYWGCTADIYLRSKTQKKSILSQTVLFYQILSESKDDVPVIYFAGMKTKYQEFLMEGLFDKNPKCSIDSNTDMIVCGTDLDLKSLPNLLFVINGFTYIFKPENLFYKDTNDNNKLIFKAKFPDANYNHIKFSQHFLFSQSISMVYNSEKNQVGFNGFNTHKYRGDDDDGSDEVEKETEIWVIIVIIIAIIIVSGIGIVIYKNNKKNRNDVPSDFIRYE